MEEKSQKALLQEAMRYAQSPAGQQLIAMLRQGDTAVLQRAMESYRSGNAAEAKKLMEQVLATPQGRKAMEQLGK